jgi:hypothetical protein
VAHSPGGRSFFAVFYKCDETIQSHVFRGFLALALKKELDARLARLVTACTKILFQN